MFSVVSAAPVHGVRTSSTPPAASPAFHPLAIAFGLLPLPILAGFKYAYLRYRRGQSIHAHGIPSAPSKPSLVDPTSLSSSLAPPAAPRSRFAAFLTTLQPYLVGFSGSPDWETTISCRLNGTLRRATQDARPHRPSPDESFRSRPANTSTLYSSTNSRYTTRSRLLSVSLVDPSKIQLPPSHDFLGIPDCAILHSPLQLPPTAHIPTSPRLSGRQRSLTITQTTQSVRFSFGEMPSSPPILLVNDKSISTTNSVLDKSSSSADSCSYYPLCFGVPSTHHLHIQLSPFSLH